MSRYGQDLQAEVYGGGDHGFPFAYEEWEERARERLAEGPFGYIAGGAGAEDTMRANRDAYYNWRLRPRMLRDVTDRELSVEVLGVSSEAPFMLAPVGVLELAHEEAELAVARAAEATGVPFMLSSVSSYTMERVAQEAPGARRIFQLYPSRSTELNRSLVGRAERAGYSAVVVTLDTTILGFRERDLKNAYLPFVKGEGIVNYLSDPAFRAMLQKPPEEDPREAVVTFLGVFGNPALSWRDIEEIRDGTELPVLVKGITHPDDAREARERGIPGIVVSNHGGRQVDGAVASLDALPGVREAVGEETAVLFDGGIRRGADVLKALALGADAALVGRPYAYGLAVGGEGGVRQVIRNLLADTDLELALSGLRSVSEVDRSAIAEAGWRGAGADVPSGETPARGRASERA